MKRFILTILFCLFLITNAYAANDKYFIHDIVPAEDPTKFRVTVIVWDSTATKEVKEERSFLVNATNTTKAAVLLEIDTIIKSTRLNYMDFKDVRKTIRSLK